MQQQITPIPFFEVTLVCKFRVCISTSVFPTVFPPLPPGPFSLVTTALYLYAHIYSFRRSFLEASSLMSLAGDAHIGWLLARTSIRGLST